MSLRKKRAVAILLVCCSAVTPGAIAQNISGETDYGVACAACHGRSGKGDGPVAPELRTSPPDLTLLAKKNNGVFPDRLVKQTIDGRQSLRAHGSFEMPVWGSVFSQLQPDRAEDRIGRIVEYIKSLQAH
jgi:mono/diheme cytochrome c family protein